MRSRIMLALCLFELSAALLIAPLARAADDDAGAVLYDQECAECHSLAKPLKNKKGPSLVGIVGKPAAGVPDFKYSDALRTAGIAWTRDTLDRYIADPKNVVPGGGKMRYEGLDTAEARAAIVDYLSRQN